MSGIGDIILRLKKAKGSYLNSINDNSGWFQQGKFTPGRAVTNNWSSSNPVTQGLVKAQQFTQPAGSNVQAWANPQVRQQFNQAVIQPKVQQITGPQPKGFIPTMAPLVSQKTLSSPFIDKFANVTAQGTRALVNVIPNMANSYVNNYLYNPQTKKIFPQSRLRQENQLSKEQMAFWKSGTSGDRKLSQQIRNTPEWKQVNDFMMKPIYDMVVSMSLNSGYKAGPINKDLINSKFDRMFGDGGSTVALRNGSGAVIPPNLSPGAPPAQIKLFQDFNPQSTIKNTGLNLKVPTKTPIVNPRGSSKVNVSSQNTANTQLPWETKSYLDSLNPNGLLDETINQTAFRRSAGLSPNETYTPTTKMTQEEARNAINVAQLKAQEDKVVFDGIFSKWIGKRDAAKTRATVIAADFVKVPGNPTDIIKAVENRDIKINPDQAGYIIKLRKTYDELFNEAKNAGIPMNYLQDYITHVWNRPQSEVQQIYKSASQKFGFSGNRSMPTYEEGIQMGFTPKYNNPAQILENYVRRMEETKANVELFAQLQAEGLVVHGSTVKNNPGFAPVMAPGFPPAKVNIGGNTTWISSWYAPTEIASELNRVFTPQDSGTLGKLVKGLAKTSSAVQDFTMAGGLPFTPANAWTFAQIQKEMTAGRIASPLKAFARTIFGQDKNYFSDNAGQIIKMQEHNIPVYTSFRIDKMIDPSTINRTLGEKVKTAWNAAVNDPTFQKFSPQLQISLFNDIETSALKAGKAADEAADIAAEAVKNFYGVTGSDVLAKRTQLSEDFKTAFLFASKYRNSMWNFWINDLKALGHPLDPKYRANILFDVGAVLTYLVMNEINKENTGKNLWENPQGKEMTMLIKTNDGYIGVPYMSSIATVPRTLYGMGSKGVQGDLSGMALQGKGLLSSAIRPPLDIIANQNYFGGNITDPNNPQWGDRALYLVGQYQHPYLEAGLNVLGQNLPKDVKSNLGLTSQPEPKYQTASKALEMPFRFYNNKNGQDAIQTAYYFDDRDQVTKSLDANSLNAWNVLHPQTTNGRVANSNILSSQQKAVMLLNNPNVQQAEYLLAMAEKQRGQTYDPIWDLTPTQRQIVFASRVQLPGQKNTYDTYLGKQDWYKGFLKAQSSYYDSLPKTTSNASNSPGLMSYPEPSAYVSAQMDAKNWKDPQVKAWFAARDQYNIQQLNALGIPTLNLGGYSAYSSKPKKIKIVPMKLSKIPKIKAIKAVKFKTAKPLKRLATKVTKPMSMKELQARLKKILAQNKPPNNVYYGGKIT